MWHATYRFVIDSPKLIQLIVLDTFGTSNANGRYLHVVSGSKHFSSSIYKSTPKPWPKISMVNTYPSCMQVRSDGNCIDKSIYGSEWIKMSTFVGIF